MRALVDDHIAHGRSFAGMCASAERMGRRLGLSAAREIASSKKRSSSGQKAPYGLRRAERLRKLEEDLELAAIPCDVSSVLIAAKTMAVASAISGWSAVIACFVFSGSLLLLPTVAIAVSIPAASYHLILSRPRAISRRYASAVVKGAPDAISLMVMSIRQDASLPNAISFASREGSQFSNELRRCVWHVISGTYSSFEEALHALGNRWQEFGSEIRTALDSVITASCERTEEGRRRALERANRSVVSGAKRRIEEYTLSLSTPAMMLFGLGILLPIMVGSFMPMLSWDIWSGPADPSGSSRDSMMDVALLMDFVFPAVALMIAMDAVRRHPMERKRPAVSEGGVIRRVCTSVILGASTLACAWYFVGLSELSPLVLLAGTMPVAIALVAISGRRGSERDNNLEESVQDLLFTAGARMLEGENFESSLARGCSDTGSRASDLAHRVAARAFVMGAGFADSVDEEADGTVSSALDGLKVVQRASSKDEEGAGLLAMDVAMYLRELADIEATLRMRLKPTLSMMRMSSLFMGPLVLGITYAIFLSLGSIGGGQDDSPGVMFLLLGIFLAEMNAVVCYFSLGIQGVSDRITLARSIGGSMVISQLVYSATALIAT